jgi:diguanylate cyclase (GGDEF)-like protein
MKIRTKTLLIVAITLAGLLAGLYASARVIVLDGFSEIEDSAVRENVQRAEDALGSEVAQLESTTGDWALWDDSYQFVQDGNQAYVDSNLNASTLTNLDVNFMVFVDTSGNLVYSSAVDLETGESIPLDTGFPGATPSGALYRHSGANSSVSGVINLAESPALVSSRPIMKSDREGPIMGALIIGRYIDDSFVNALQETTHTTLAVRAISGNSPDVVAVGLDSAPAGTIAVEPAGSSFIKGYSAIADVDGVPVLLLEISMARDIYAQGTATTWYLVGALLITGLVFAIVVLVSLERTVLSRLLALSGAVGKIGETTNQALRVPAAGKDEVAHLGSEINRMLGSIEDLNHSLEDKVRERTTDLEIANVELRERNRQLLEARNQAATDGLTGLPNHRTFQEAIRKLVPNTGETPVSLVMLDVDGFKLANDALGHQAGDEILRSCARIFSSNSRGHYVYRYGGDEFAVIITGVELDDAELLAERLREAVQNGGGVSSRHVTISLGVASYPATATSPEELIYEADAAMYTAKLAGKNRTCRWDRMADVVDAMASRRSAPVN